MSRPSISTGGIPFMEKSEQQKGRQAPGNLPCHVLILADFSGRNHRGLDDVSCLVDRKIIPLTRDNLDEVFQRLQVTLDIGVADKPIVFNEPDDLHQLPSWRRSASSCRRTPGSDSISSASS